jgi:hypothetical protein
MISKACLNIGPTPRQATLIGFDAVPQLSLLGCAPSLKHVWQLSGMDVSLHLCLEHI